MIRALTLLLGLLASGAAFAAEALPPPPGGSHAELACAQCHTGDGSTPADCDACHEAARSNPHPVGVAASMKVPDDLPLGEGRVLLCRTCHRIHGESGEHGYVRNGDPCFANRRKFCFRCHEEGMGGMSPHAARRGPSRCLFCHVEPPGGAARPAETVRRPIGVTCRFCHGMSEAGHALLPGPTPPGLPNRECAACHDPHGSSQTTHFLKIPVAQSTVRAQETSPHVADYDACRGCHSTSFADEITPENLKLLFGGNRVMLCISCHTPERSHHPVGVAPGEAARKRIAEAGLRLPLDSGGAIDCVTCHLPGCLTGSYDIGLRYYDRKLLRDDLCWGCHVREEFTSHDPHGDDPADCRWCHESRAIPGPGGLGGLVASATMVCLPCHPVTPHPSGKNHVGFTVGSMDPDGALPVEPGGVITCATCHEPHHAGSMPGQRLRSRSAALCRHCHRGK